MHRLIGAVLATAALAVGGPAGGTGQDEAATAPGAGVRLPGGGQNAKPAAVGVSEVDLKALEARLAATDAIGFFTKLELKSQLDELVKDFERYHEVGQATRLAALRERFDLLLMKILTLLQDDDPQLHGDIVRARAEIWRSFADPERFAGI